MTKRALPALGLFFLAPLVAEFVLGNLPITALFALVALAPLYGGGAVLIREIVRRRGGGYPSVVLLALAYGVLEEGVTTMSLFNPNYAGLRLLDPGHLDALGMGGPWTVFVLGLHTVWSITVPIVVMESISRRPREPWLGKLGLSLYAVLFVLGVVANNAFAIANDPFVAEPGQFAGVAVAIVVLVALAIRVGKRPRLELAGAVPPIWMAGITGLVLSSAWMLSDDLINAPWLKTAVVLAIDGLATALLLTWSRRTAWTQRHSLAVAGGALLTYVWHAFPESPVSAASATTDLIGNILFGLVAVAVLVFAAHRSRADS
ncbi:hypothetical protein ABZS29_06155 [Kribbella sp. NPDC005582]|uniref:hypothetical protein n=1 Tax=Kribbella sp. NPDC005582 TaxID=3156893 RepID=UPI0033AC6501